jgi:hypothetical protein
VEDLARPALGFDRTAAARTGRPGDHPAVLLKLFLCGCLNRVPSSRCLEREAGRNVALMWPTGRLVPDHKTIADFRRDNGPAIRRTCAACADLCRRIGVLKGDCVAIDGSKFRAVNSEAPKRLPIAAPSVQARWATVRVSGPNDRNSTSGQIASRIAHLEASVERYIDEMVRIDRPEEGEVRAEKVANLGRRYARIQSEIRRLQAMERALEEVPDGQISLTDPDARAMATSARHSGPVKDRCTTSKQRRITRWEHEHLVDEMQDRITGSAGLMRLRRSTVEHPFGTIKASMGATHFQMRRLGHVRTEMALHVLAYNIKRMLSMIGVPGLMQALSA